MLWMMQVECDVRYALRALPGLMPVASGVNYGWIEVNAQHAFIRDEMSKVVVVVVVMVVMVVVVVVVVVTL